MGIHAAIKQRQSQIKIAPLKKLQQCLLWIYQK
jgi:hypothetical protein